MKKNYLPAVIALIAVMALSVPAFFCSGCQLNEKAEETDAGWKEGVDLIIDDPGVFINDFYVSGGEFFSGDKVTSKLAMINESGHDFTFWIGCSIQDPMGSWYDLPAHSLTLEAKEKGTVNFSWPVPEKDTQLISGPYLITIAVWSEKPGEENAERMATVQKKGAFHVLKSYEDFSYLDEDLWKKSSHPLGLSLLEPDNVKVENEMLKITMPANTLNGGQLESREYDHLYGSYRVSMKLPDAPSSITGFFLYRAPDYYHEVDIEVVNDPSGKVWFTTYAEGKVTNSYETYLGFDPTEDYHEYRFDLYPDQVSFYINGLLYKSFNGGLTDKPMKLMINSWFPDWLDGLKPETDAVTRVEWIKY